MWIIQNTRSESSRGGRILAVHDKWLSPSLRGEYRGLWIGCDRIGIFMDRASGSGLMPKSLLMMQPGADRHANTQSAAEFTKADNWYLTPQKRRLWRERALSFAHEADYDAWVLSFLATKEEALHQRDEHVRASFSYIGKVIIILFYDSPLFSMGKIAMRCLMNGLAILNKLWVKDAAGARKISSESRSSFFRSN